MDLGEHAQALFTQVRKQHLHALAIEVELIGPCLLSRFVKFIDALRALAEPKHSPFVADASAVLQSLDGRRHHAPSDFDPTHPTALFQPRHSCSRMPSRSIPGLPR